jgi:hypothetical protein
MEVISKPSIAPQAGVSEGEARCNSTLIPLACCREFHLAFWCINGCDQKGNQTNPLFFKQVKETRWRVIAPWKIRP